LRNRTLYTADGIPYLAPELVLLVKAKHDCPRDQADFDETIAHMTQTQRKTLADLLARAHPRHRWQESLLAAPSATQPWRIAGAVVGHAAYASAAAGRSATLVP
jgi:hypothetical protein